MTLSSSTSSSTTTSTSTRRILPNILLLMTDQFRYDAFSPEITPNLYNLWKPQQQPPSTTTTSTTTQNSNSNSDSNNNIINIWFENAYSSTPTCTPARAALLTGKSPWAHGMLGYASTTNCSNYPTTIPRILHQLLNYTTAAIGKNHFGPIKHIQGYQYERIYDGISFYDDDYDEWYKNNTAYNNNDDPLCNMTWNEWKPQAYCHDLYKHPTEWTTREALQYLNQYKKQQQQIQQQNQSTSTPLFLKVSYHRPHSPYDPPMHLWKEFLYKDTNSSNNHNHRYNVSQLQRHVNNSSWDIQYRETTTTNNTSTTTNNTSTNTSFYNSIWDHPEAYKGDPGMMASRLSRSAYLANIAMVDDGIGKILSWNNNKNNNNNNNNNNKQEPFFDIILWTSDHGDMNGDHYLWRKGYPWEASSHIPLLIHISNKDKIVSSLLSTTSSTKKQRKKEQQEQEEEKVTQQRQPQVQPQQVQHEIFFQGQQQNNVINDDNDNDGKNDKYHNKLSSSSTSLSSSNTTSSSSFSFASPSSSSSSYSSSFTSTAIVELRDIAPTIYDILGILPTVQTLDPTMNGKSLVPILLESTLLSTSSTSSTSSAEFHEKDDDKDNDNNINNNNNNNTTNGNKNIKQQQQQQQHLPLQLHLQVRPYLDLEHAKLFGEFYWNALIGYMDHNNNDITENNNNNTENKNNNNNNNNNGNDSSSSLLLYKYIYNAMDGREQLFCLTNDPHEWNDLVLALSWNTTTTTTTTTKNTNYKSSSTTTTNEQQQQQLQQDDRQTTTTTTTSKTRPNNENNNNNNITTSNIETILNIWRQRLIQQFEQEGRGDDWVKNGMLQIRPNKSIVFGPNYPCLSSFTTTTETATTTTTT